MKKKYRLVTPVNFFNLPDVQNAGARHGGGDIESETKRLCVCMSQSAKRGSERKEERKSEGEGERKVIVDSERLQ